MVNAVVEPQSAGVTASYEASTSAQGNWAADWRGDTTNGYWGALPFTLDTRISEVDVERQKLELDITQEFEFADGEATLLTRLAGVLPAQMSKTQVDQLRMRFPQPPATDDPATYEFETHQD